MAYSRKQMVKLAREQQVRLENAGLDSTNYHLMNDMEKIIEECQTESTTEFIYEEFFLYGDFSANKRTITNLLKPQLPKKVKNLRDVHLFFAYLYDVDKVAFHCDDDFADYVNGKGIAFTASGAAKRNTLMEQSFTVCEKANVSVYGMGNLEFRKRYLHLF